MRGLPLLGMFLAFAFSLEASAGHVVQTTDSLPPLVQLEEQLTLLVSKSGSNAI